MTDNALGTYLKACRDRTQTTHVGIGSFGQRRVPGLRREEVAMLAGVSMDYYARLEQGRERRPSGSVLDSLARVFSLTDDQRAHLFRLAGSTVPSRVSRPRDAVDVDLLQLVDDWPMNPAVIVTRFLDVLASNAIATALFGGLEPGENLVERIFLDPSARDLYPDWPQVAESAVANLRLAEGFAPQDARLLELVADLLDGSEEFVQLWARGDVRGKTSEAKRFRHVEVGVLDLTYQSFDVRTAPGQQLIVYHAAPHSPSAQSLKLLGSLAASLG